MKVGFVHVPALPEQVIQGWAESPFMPMEMTRQALSLVISRQIQLVNLKLYTIPELSPQPWKCVG